MRTDELLKLWSGRLSAAGIESPALEAELLYAEAAGLRRGAWFPDVRPDPEAVRKGETWLARRCRREPLQYIVGHAPFRELELPVSPAVLIPRPETELLVDELLKRLPQGGSLLDVGTGSGAIALSAAFERPDAVVTAADISPDALTAAKCNAAKYGLPVSFLESDLLSNVSGKFDAIAANLPYVTEAEFSDLEPELYFEPKLALTAPEDGLQLIRKLIRQAPDHLNANGSILLEVGAHQARKVAQEMKVLGYFEVQILCDYCSIERFVAARSRKG